MACSSLSALGSALKRTQSPSTVITEWNPATAAPRFLPFQTSSTKLSIPRKPLRACAECGSHFKLKKSTSRTIAHFQQGSCYISCERVLFLTCRAYSVNLYVFTVNLSQAVYLKPTAAYNRDKYTHTHLVPQYPNLNSKVHVAEREMSCKSILQSKYSWWVGL